MPVRTLTRSFAGGEIAPELAGRLDLNKYQTGAALLRNFEVLPHGPIQNCAGWGYVLETKYSALNSILLPFVYNSEQSYELEFGDQYLRFHTAGGTVLNASQSITSMTLADPAVFTKNSHGYTNGVWVFLSDITGPTALDSRFYKIAAATTNTFQLTDLAGNAISSDGMPAFVSGNIASVYEIVSPYVEADVGELNITQSNDVLTITHDKYATRELRRVGATNWTFTIISTLPTQVAPTALAGTASGGSGLFYRYKATAVAEDGQEESLSSGPAINAASTVAITGATNANPGVITTASAHGLSVGNPVYILGAVGMPGLNGEWYVNTVPAADTLTLKSLGGVVLDTTALGTWTSGGTVSLAHIESNIPAGNRITITFTPAAGAIRYNFYKWRSGVWAYVGQSAESTFIDDNIAPDISQTPPESAAPFDGTDNFPRAVGYFQGRRWFAGSISKPHNLWATRSGTESNMSHSIPTRDADAINVRLTARRASTIRHIVPLRDLLILTSEAEWSVTAATGAVITPLSIDYVPQGYIGASTVPPVVTSEAVIYEQDRGGRIREMLYSWEKSGYKTNDLSIMAPHLFDGHHVAQMAYVRAPHSMVFVARDDGVLLGLTYLPEHQVAAWWQRVTDGLFKSVIAVPEGNEDVVYAIIQREIDGRTVKYIERRHERVFNTLADAFFVDAGVSYDGAPTGTFGNLHHLEGETVAILADGAVLPPQVVENGEITLLNDVVASKVHIGKGYVADMHSLPLSYEAAAFGQGKQKNVNAAYVRVQNTSGLFVGILGGRLAEAKQRTDEPYGSPPDMLNGETKVDLKPLWSKDGQLHIQQADPLPTTILSITLETAVGGN